jgi:hypothetical protein
LDQEMQEWAAEREDLDDLPALPSKHDEVLE